MLTWEETKMLLAIAFLCFALQVAAWVVLPSSARVAPEDESVDLPGEAVAA